MGSEKVEKLTLCGRVFKLPYKSLFPPMTPAERKRLENSIHEVGLLDPITVDQDDNVIDGHNRLEMANMLGLGLAELKVETIVIKSLEQVQAITNAKNAARRHLSDKALEEWRKTRRGESVRLVMEEGLTQREAAERLGVGLGTVSRDVAKAELDVVPHGTTSSSPPQPLPVKDVTPPTNTQHRPRSTSAIKERWEKVAVAFSAGVTIDQIAADLGVSHATVSVDLAKLRKAGDARVMMNKTKRANIKKQRQKEEAKRIVKETAPPSRRETLVEQGRNNPEQREACLLIIEKTTVFLKEQIGASEVRTGNLLNGVLSALATIRNQLTEARSSSS